MYLGVVADIFDKVWGIIAGVLLLIPKFFYFLLNCILGLIDLMQLLFRRLAGLDNGQLASLGASEVEGGDYAYNIIYEIIFGTKYPVLNTLFWSIIILSAILLVVATIIAVIRIEYAPDKEKKNSKAGIIGNFFKAMAHFAIIPLGAIFGLYLGNVVLVAIDSATSVNAVVDNENSSYLVKANGSEVDGSGYGGTYVSYNIFGNVIYTNTTPFTSTIFIGSCYNANRLRQGDGIDFYNAMGTTETHGKYTNVTDFGFIKKNTLESTANTVDYLFSINATLKNPAKLNLDYGPKGLGSDNLVDPWKSQVENNISQFNKYNIDLVFYYYNILSMNWIVAFAVAIIIIKTMWDLVFSLIARIAQIIVLFFAGPLTASIMPLEGGEAFKKWRSYFIGQVLYSVFIIFVMNMLYLLLPILYSIDFFGGKLTALNWMINTFVLVAGVKAVEAIRGTLSKIFLDKTASSVADGLEKTREGTLSAISAGAKAGIGVGKAVGHVAIGAGRLAASGVNAIGAGTSQIRANRARHRSDVAHARATAANDSLFAATRGERRTRAGEDANIAGIQQDMANASYNATTKQQFIDNGGTQHDLDLFKNTKAGKGMAGMSDDDLKNSSEYKDYLTKVANGKKGEARVTSYLDQTAFDKAVSMDNSMLGRRAEFLQSREDLRSGKTLSDAEAKRDADRAARWSQDKIDQNRRAYALEEKAGVLKDKAGKSIRGAGTSVKKSVYYGHKSVGTAANTANSMTGFGDNVLDPLRGISAEDRKAMNSDKDRKEKAKKRDADFRKWAGFK